MAVGGLVLAWTLAIGSRDLTSHLLWDQGLSAGAHPNPTLAGDTLYAVAKVLCVSDDNTGAGRVQLRVVAIKNQTAAEAFTQHGDALFAPELEKTADQKIPNKVVEITRTLYVPRR